MENDKAQSKIAEIKSDVKDIVKNDLAGAGDWKGSKIGFLTGSSAIRRSVGTIGSSMADSSDRLSGLIRHMITSPELKSLPDGGSQSDRFLASMKLHGKAERDLPIILRNTYWGAITYLLVSVLYVLLVAIYSWIWPAPTIFTAALRFGVMPFLMALTFKHLYTNWIVRTRSLGSALQFMRSMDWLPQRG